MVEINCYGVECTGWELVHPRATFDMLGYVPGFIDISSDAPLRDQINAGYVSGWHRSASEWVRISNTLQGHPEDPPFPMIARYRHQPTGELLEFYTSCYTAIVQPDGTFEVARLD
jgi:hypothetical protein